QELGHRHDRVRLWAARRSLEGLPGRVLVPHDQLRRGHQGAVLLERRDVEPRHQRDYADGGAYGALRGADGHESERAARVEALGGRGDGDRRGHGRGFVHDGQRPELDGLRALAQAAECGNRGRLQPRRGAVHDRRGDAQRQEGHVRRRQAGHRHELRSRTSMRKAWLLLGLGLATQGGQGARTLRVEVVPHEAERRVDVLVAGKPFTSYIYPSTLKKPTLYPLRAASGAVVTRGWPLEPGPGERVDHPHQVGLWFDYGDVNGLDFWNNSDAIPAARAPKMGTILHRAVRRAESGQGEGVLEVTAEWVD